MSRGAQRKVWWLGACEHEWEALFSNRIKGQGCPYCVNKAILVGFNDLATTHPDLAVEWHPTKNGAMTAHDVVAGTNKKIWWLGTCDHEWEAAGSSRLAGRGCPFCANRAVLVGFNDLATTHPGLAAEWHPTKNGDLRASDVVSGTHAKVWWAARCGHEWAAGVTHRSRGIGCPYCVNKAVLVGFNDLATTHPDLAAQWHPTKNGDLTANSVVAGTNKKAWWTGPCGHDWAASPSKRSGGRGCPYCGSNAVLIGFNDLATTHPVAAAEWHPTRNGDLTPESVAGGSHTTAWWRCGLGHDWQAKVFNRAKGRGCPYCVNKTVLVGFNDLATTHPDLAAEWHPTKNGNLTPSDVSYGADVRAWWSGACSHEWVAVVFDRTRRGRPTQCPACANHISAPEADLAAVLAALRPDCAVLRTQNINGTKMSVDLLVPDRNLAVEFNGVYWHSEANGRLHDAHLTKFRALRAQGIDLHVVWSDDWARPSRRAAVVRALAHRLEASQRVAEGLLAAGLDIEPGALRAWSERVGARTLTPETSPSAEAREFLDVNHSQGSSRVVTSYGLRDGAGTLRAVLDVRARGRGTWEIVRYATSGSVPGGFTRLLAYAERQTGARGQAIERWVTFSDHSISAGGLYEKNGFVVDGEIPPDYSYLISDGFGGRREHKFNYRVAAFHARSDLLAEDGMSERELAALNGLVRVWDYGKTRWARQVANESKKVS